MLERTNKSTDKSEVRGELQWCCRNHPRLCCLHNVAVRLQDEVDDLPPDEDEPLLLHDGRVHRDTEGWNLGARQGDWGTVGGGRGKG